MDRDDLRDVVAVHGVPVSDERFLVAMAPIRGAHWSGLRGVTATRWAIDTTPMISVAVRVSAVLDGDDWLPGTPETSFDGLFLEGPPEPDDAVPIKGSADVTASFGQSSILARSAIEVASAGARATPIDHAARTPVGPLDPNRGVVIARDLDRFHHAPPSARLPAIGATLAWTIDGAEAAKGKLGFTIGCRADFVDGGQLLFTTGVDSLRVRPGEHAVDLVFRGIFVDEPGRLLDRIVVGVVPETRPAEAIEEGADAPAEWGPLFDAALPIAAFALSASFIDATTGTRPPELTAEERDAARVSAFSDGPGEPSLTPEEHRAIRAELARRPRKEVLAEFGLDEIAWTREEWAVAEILADAGRSTMDAPDDEDAEPALDARAAIWTEAMKPARPTKLDLDACARLQAHLTAREPGKVLAEAGMTVAEYVGLEAALSDRLDDDAAASERFDALVAKYTPEAQEKAAAEERETIGADEDEDE